MRTGCRAAVGLAGPCWYNFVTDSERFVEALAESDTPSLLNARAENAALETRRASWCIGKVTVATNMAGRGTDIRLGGNAAEFAKVTPTTRGRACVLTGGVRISCALDRSRCSISFSAH